MFNFNEVDANQFRPLPAEVYKVIVDDVNYQETRSGTGEYIKVKYIVQDGDYKDRVIFQNFNVKNDNEKAVQIGLAQLKGFLIAVGYGPETLGEVTRHGLLEMMDQKEVMVKLKIKSDPNFGDRNEVTKHIPLNAPTIKEDPQQDIPF